ncbi:MAG: DNA repair protein RecO [Cyanobacteria bacterium P01_F01_bin.53]
MKQRSYKATGINLKAMAMGESDRLVTVLTKEQGLIRAIAPGARKHKSRLGGRSGLFVVNEGLFTKGKSIDKLVQAETVKSFPGLSTNLAKLTASQYLAEIALSQALTEQPQEELYYLLIEHLTRLERAPQSNILPCLTQGTFHLLALAGVAPEVFRCCLTRSPLDIELGNPDWRVGFSVSSGGAVSLGEIENMERDRLHQVERLEEDRLARLGQLPPNATPLVQEATANYANSPTLETTITTHTQTHTPSPSRQIPRPTFINPNGTYHSMAARGGPNISIHAIISKEIARDLGLVGYLSAAELALMQQLSKPELVMGSSPISSRSGTIKSGTIGSNSLGANGSALFESGPHQLWRHIEKFLRHYTQYQLDRPIRSAALIDTCFNT